MQSKNITIKDVAREADVSLATVSRVINNSPKVAERTRVKVQDVIDRLGFEPDEVARNLASNNPNNIGVILPDITNTYYTNITRGIQDVAKMFQYNVLIMDVDNAKENERAALRTLNAASNVHGIILVGTTQTDDELEESLSKIKKSTVVSSFDVSFAPSVSTDYLRIFTEIFQTIQPQSVSLLSGPKGISKYDTLCDVFKTVFKTSQTMIHRIGLNAIDASEILKKTDRGLFITFTEAQAFSLLEQAKAYELRVPEDIEIISLNQTELAKVAIPRLSTVGQTVYDLGAVSMRQLTKIFHSEPVDNHIYLKYDMLYRDSTKHMN